MVSKTSLIHSTHPSESLLQYKETTLAEGQCPICWTSSASALQMHFPPSPSFCAPWEAGLGSLHLYPLAFLLHLTNGGTQKRWVGDVRMEEGGGRMRLKALPFMARVWQWLLPSGKGHSPYHAIAIAIPRVLVAFPSLCPLEPLAGEDSQLLLVLEILDHPWLASLKPA